MLFGYETVSYDNPNYGKYFWDEWRKGKSFSKAFLDASWRISHRQAPAVVACGATKNEAINRVFNERKLYWGAVSRNWWWWRWYYAASSATAARAFNQDRRLPASLLRTAALSTKPETYPSASPGLRSSRERETAGLPALEVRGFEPLTYGLQSHRSSQLSYTPGRPDQENRSSI